MKVTQDVVGVGNAIVDVLSLVEDSFIVENNLNKGQMTLIDEQRVKKLYSEMPASIKISGGSAANTMVGVSALGGEACYIGKITDDDFGNVFHKDLNNVGVKFDSSENKLNLPTGCCLIQVTPDAQRTLNTHLGISAYLSPTDVDPHLVASGKILYCEGYLWDTDEAKAAIRYAMDIAKQFDRTVALALSDVRCVERHREDWLDLLDDFVNLMFGNEQELCSLYETESLMEALKAASEKVGLVFVTLGERGSLGVKNGEIFEVPVSPVERLVDTTGAGDLYASGVLFGISQGISPYQSACLGSVVAAEAVTHVGARPERDLKQLSNKFFSDLPTDIV